MASLLPNPLKKATTSKVVALAGATGHLGGHIAKALLSSEFSPYFSKVVFFSRDVSSSKLDDFKLAGAEIREYDTNKSEELEKAFTDVDVMINAVSGGHDGHVFKAALLKAITSPTSTVKLYFPSEFGVDHTVHDFPHPEWDAKKEHAKLAAAASSYMKVCRVYVGFFLEDSIGPWFGLNTKEGKYEAVGSADRPISFTGLDDIGRAVATLAGVVPQKEVPSELRIAGDSKSIREIAQIMGAAGAGDIEVTEVELEPYKKEALKPAGNEPAGCLRFLMGEGKINHNDTAMGNSDDLVNPGGKSWKWKTVEAYAKETNGRPWCN